MRTPMTASPSEWTVDDRFFDLICDDPDLLDAEFEAIVAAEWPVPPPRHRCGGDVEPPGDGPDRRGTVGIDGRPARPPGLIRQSSVRQRSPPARHR